MAIIEGRVPSLKPEHPYAAGCLNDSLWNIVQACWDLDHKSRPTASDALNYIKELLQRGIISLTALTPSQPSMNIGSKLENWPSGIEEFSQHLSSHSKETIASRRMADVLM